VIVVYPGVAPRFRPLPPEETGPVRRRLQLPERFLLFVSTLEPRKNLVRLLEAFAQLDHRPPTTDHRPGRQGDTGVDPQRSATQRAPGVQRSAFSIQRSSGIVDNLHLVIAGRRGWLYEEIFAAIERLRLGEKVPILDFVDDNDLPALYNLAWAFVYPSIYEGFGLPAIEALACGTPVLTADNSSLPEVVGDAAVLVPADDTGAIAAGMARIVHDEDLRARLRAAGPARARSFTWERAAQQVLDCYRS
jgi:glycosyltransferase involved in cell wall biosynthesis